MDAKQKPEIELRGQPLTISEVAAVGRGACSLALHEDPRLAAEIRQAAELVNRAVEEGWSVYGVTTGFGGMANVPVPAEDAAASQNNLLSFLAASAGEPIDNRHIRAAMVLRANVLLQAKSGVREELIERLVRFLQADAIPVVRELGSIGASGDLVPLSAIARSITGHPHVRVQCGQKLLSGPAALDELGLEPLELLPKEGLAIVNGTSFSSAIAANCVEETRRLFGLTLAVQAMMLHALQAQGEPFAAFVHEHKRHPGQIWVAKQMRRLLQRPQNATEGNDTYVQDRYSIRCLPQYLGPIAEGLARVTSVVETEMNSVSDNPLVDAAEQRFYQSGNFLGQYVGMAMDDLRRFLGLMAKHLDTQIALLVAPEFSGGLPPSLRGNSDRSYNMGLKGLQITGNSIAPTLVYYGNPIVEHFPTHAEQFNQNVNGLSWSSANLAWKSVGLYQHYLGVALLFAIQALDLRAQDSLGHCRGDALLGKELAHLYRASMRAMGLEADSEQPLLHHDEDLWLEDRLQSLVRDLCDQGEVLAAVAQLQNAFEEELIGDELHNAERSR